MESLTTHLVLTSDAPIDLQMHTTFSDGLWTVEELIDYLAREQFALAAVTDHDRVDTVAYVQQIAAQKNLPILAAVEISTSWRGYMVDVLCYGFDPERNTLLDLTEPIVRRQSENTQQVYLELLRKGYIFPHQHEILAKNGGEPRQLMDLICLLQNHKYTTDNTLLEKILVDAGFLLIMLDITDVVEAAHQSCAVCLIAHPGRRGGKYPCFDLPLLDQLRKEAPIDGLEVYHPSHSPQQVVAYLDYVQKHRLLMSTGSDSHGDPKQMPIKYHAKMSRLLLERVGIQVK